MLRLVFLTIHRPAKSSLPGVATSTMEKLYSIPFTVLECPNLKLKKPSWVKQPSAMTMFAIVLLSYFLVTGGRFSCIWIVQNEVLVADKIAVISRLCHKMLINECN